MTDETLTGTAAELAGELDRIADEYGALAPVDAAIVRAAALILSGGCPQENVAWTLCRVDDDIAVSLRICRTCS